MAESDKAERAAMLVPDATKENHVDDLRNAARTRGISIEDAVKAKVAQWRVHHDADPTAGFNRLIDWLESAKVEPVDGTPVVETTVDKAPRTTRGKSAA